PHRLHACRRLWRGGGIHAGRAGRAARSAPAGHHPGHRHARYRARLRPLRLPGSRLRVVHRRYRWMARQRRDDLRTAGRLIEAPDGRLPGAARAVLPGCAAPGQPSRLWRGPPAARDPRLRAGRGDDGRQPHALQAARIRHVRRDRGPGRRVLPPGCGLREPAALLALHLPAVHRNRRADGSALCAGRRARWRVHGRHPRCPYTVRTRHVHGPRVRDLVRLVPARARRSSHRPADPAARRRVGRHPAPRASCARVDERGRRSEGEGRMTMLRVRDMTVRFGGISALDGVSLDLTRGEILGLIGPNGAGKTTLFNCISGVIRPDRGSIFFDGHSLTYAPPHVRAKLGVARTFQNLQLWPSMTVGENLMVPMDALGTRNTFSDALYMPFSLYAERAEMERARAILHVLDLDRYRNALAGDLPAGIQRRVEIARALARNPKLLLLDEPAAGLDAKETSRLSELLHTVRDRFHVSMLLVDHAMSLVMRVCDYVYVLDFGKLLARGQPATIRNDPKVLAAYLGEESQQRSGVQSIARVRSDERPLLDVQGLAAGYGGLEVIRDVSLAVRAGEV